jgi:hypothetical protein
MRAHGTDGEAAIEKVSIMGIMEITDRKYIERAIAEYGRGPEKFLEKYHFKRPSKYWFTYKGKPYPAKAIVGAAYQYVPGSKGPLRGGQFSSGTGSSGNKDIFRLLRRLAIIGEAAGSRRNNGINLETASKERTEEAPVTETEPASTVRASGNLETEIEHLRWDRKNQAKFCNPVKHRWRGRCAVTGIEATPLLEACHIKPWSASDDRERLDPFNGLYLAAHVHAALDAGLIGVSPEGDVRISERLSQEDRLRMNLVDFMRIRVTDKHRPYLEYRYSRFLEAKKR